MTGGRSYLEILDASNATDTSRRPAGSELAGTLEM